MNTGCQEIDQILNLLKSTDNSVRDVTKWTKIDKVITMQKKLTPDLKTKIQKISGLKYWRNESTRFDEPREGFACIKCSTAIVFPLK